jgi:hypothetical protein
MKHFFTFLFFFHFFAFTSLAQKEKQRGLLVFGEIRKDYYENDYQQGGIQKADTFPSKEVRDINTYRYFNLPFIHYVLIRGQRMTNYAISGNWAKRVFQESINGAAFTTKKSVSLDFKTSYAESYNYLSLFKGKMKAYVGGITQLEINKENRNMRTRLSLSAYTNLVYVHKKHYWIELGIPKEIVSYTRFRKPSTIAPALQNELKSSFPPMKIGFGFGFVF